MQRGTWNVRAGLGIALALADTDGDGEFDTATIINTGISTGAGGSPTDAITGQIGGGGAIIPGLQGSIDIRVAGTNDDEFDTTDTSDPMTGWTTIGTPTTHNINSTIKSAYYVSKTAAAGIGVHGIRKASPSLPFTVTAQITPGVMEANARAGLMVGVATPGQMISLSWDGTNSTDTFIHIDQWTSPTVYQASVASATVGYYPYLRIICTSSTAIQMQFSPNGYLWYDYAGSLNPGFTIASVGLFVNQSVGTKTVTMASDWIRFT
jgi:hypothetical protein